MSEHTPYIDIENLPAPNDGFLVTQFITVRDRCICGIPTAT
jgi:hypothetical protein